MEFNVITDPKDVQPHVSQVRAVADRHREEFGFLPFSAYEELATKGQLWIVRDAQDSRLLGYLIFGGSGTQSKVFQLYVEAAVRGHGIGSALLDRLKQHTRACHRQLIIARVASDLPANKFWEKRGFYVINQVAGGRASGRTINLRVYELPQGSLIENNDATSGLDWLQTPESDPLFSSPAFALDLNVILDVTQGRLDADLAGRLFSAAFDGELRLCVSTEFIVELKRNSKTFADDPLLKFAERLPVLPEIEKHKALSLITSLREIVFRDRNPSGRRATNDVSDLHHLAACAYHRIRGFVTRERAILRASAELAQRFGVQVLSPFDLILPQEPDSAGAAFPSIRLGDVAITCAPYEDARYPDVSALLCKLEVSEHRLREVIESGTSTRRRRRFLIYGDDNLIACVSFHEAPVNHKSFQVFAVVDESLPGAQTAIDHALGSLLGAIPKQRLIKCELQLSPSQLATRSTANTLGFTRSVSADGGLVLLSKMAYRGVVTYRNWSQFSTEFQRISGTGLPSVLPKYEEATCTGLLLHRSPSATKRAIDILSFETLMSPLLIATEGRPAVLVPIRDKQASELLPGVEVQASLFKKEAIVRLERAYFSRPSAAKLFRRGSLVVFYVSAAAGGRGEAVGIARITSSGTSSPVQINLGLLRQGVLSEDDLEKMGSSSSEVGYFTFDSFLSFHKPLSFQKLKELGCIGGANLITSQSLDFRQLMAIIDRAFEEGVNR